VIHTGPALDRRTDIAVVKPSLDHQPTFEHGGSELQMEGTEEEKEADRPERREVDSI
jgi:hypothetical protein